MKNNKRTIRFSTKSKKGSMLIVTLMVLITLMGMGLAFGLSSSTEKLIANRQHINAKAFHLAEAGIELGMYYLRQDYVKDFDNPSWSDGSIYRLNNIGPNYLSYYNMFSTIPPIEIGGDYTVSLKNVPTNNMLFAHDDAIWIKSEGHYKDQTQTIESFIGIDKIIPWQYAVYIGKGYAGQAISNDVDIRGSVMVMGTDIMATDSALVFDSGGKIGNNYTGMSLMMLNRVPALPTKIINSETVSTLSASLKVKNGLIELGSSALIGEEDISGNSVKETLDSVFIGKGFIGDEPEDHVYSDNSYNNHYDLGDSVTFPSLDDPYMVFASYKAAFETKAYVIQDEAQLTQLENITPNSLFSYVDEENGYGSISMNGSGVLTIDGNIYIKGNISFNNVSETLSTIQYSGNGTILVDEDVNINTNLVTSGMNSYPSNIIGFMTANNIRFSKSGLDAMGLFYAENSVIMEEQTDIFGSVVTNYFDTSDTLSKVYQIPSVMSNLPSGIIGQRPDWHMTVVSWRSL